MSLSSTTSTCRALSTGCRRNGMAEFFTPPSISATALRKCGIEPGPHFKADDLVWPRLEVLDMGFNRSLFLADQLFRSAWSDTLSAATTPVLIAFLLSRHGWHSLST